VNQTRGLSKHLHQLAAAHSKTGEVRRDITCFGDVWVGGGGGGGGGGGARPTPSSCSDSGETNVNEKY